jgi:predicted RNase H-like HicB family nuclease
MNKNQYSVIIQWSEEDQAYVVTLPEWGGCHTHGATYEEAARHAREVLEMLIEGEEAAGRSLPPCHGFMFPGPSGFNYELNHCSTLPVAKSSDSGKIESLKADLAATADTGKKKTIRAKLRRSGHYGGLRNAGKTEFRIGHK